MDLLSAALNESGIGDFVGDDHSTTSPSKGNATNGPTKMDTSPSDAGNIQANSVSTPTSEATPEPPPISLDEVDMFSQALMQLSETNKQAEVFEKEHQKTHPVPKPKQPAAPARVTQNVHVLPTVTTQPGHVMPTVTTQTATLPRQSVNTYGQAQNIGYTGIQAVQSPNILTATRGNAGSPLTVLHQLPQQSMRTGSPITLTSENIKALQRSGSPITVLRRTGSPTLNNAVTATGVTPDGKGNLVYIKQAGVTPNVQTKKITLVRNSSGIQQIITTPQQFVTTTPQRIVTTTPQRIVTTTPQRIVTTTPQRIVTTTPQRIINTTPQRIVTTTPQHLVPTTPQHLVTTMGQTLSGIGSMPKGALNLVRQTVSAEGGKKVHVVTLNPQVMQTPTGPKKVTITKLQPGTPSGATQTITPGFNSNSSVASPLARIVQNTAGQQFTVTRTSDGQIQIIKPTVRNLNQHFQPQPQQQSAVHSPQPVITVTAQQPIVQPKIITMGATPMSNQVLLTTTQSQVAKLSQLPNSVVSHTNQQANGSIKLTEKDVSRLWINDDFKLKSITSQPQMQLPAQGIGLGGVAAATAIDEAEEDEMEELGYAETYADYMPEKSKIGLRHPDTVVETSSLSSVEPPDIWYTLSIPESIIDYGQLSALQLETIIYCSQKHDTFLPNGERAGFLVGDGAGVGKGRTIAGIIYENYLQGRKRSLWLSVSNDLQVDAERDLRDIGAGKIEVHPLNKFKYAKISSHINGSVKKGVVFATYSSLIGESQSDSKYRTRFKQLVHWLGKEFDGCIVFDECHRAKNLCPTGSSKPSKTGTTVLELQNKLKKARIVYASATGASEPKNMAYMTRLGLWGKGTPFNEFMDFINAIEKRGVGAMELVAMDMKLRGQYIARQLSFKGVSFKISEIPVPKEFYKIYNDSVKLWVEAREAFQLAADLLDAEHKMKKSMWGQFWSSHQRYFKYLCISAKVPHCVKLAREAVKNGKCVVIGLQSTGEARTLEQLEDSGGVLDDFVSTVKGVFQTLVEKHFPAPDRKKTSDWFSSSMWDDSPVPSPSNGRKRKKKVKFNNSAKKARNDRESDWSSSSSDASDDDKKKANKSSSSDSSKSSESELELSSDDASSDDEGDDNFNPFGNGSDSDDDPWLKKSSGKKKKAPKEKKKKPPKEKKKKKKKKKSKKKRDNVESESDSDDDIDKKFDDYLKNSSINAAIGGTSKVGGFSSAEAVEKTLTMKGELLRKLDRIADRLPSNTLDELIDSLGGPDSVAEMTGRKGRVVTNDDGAVQYESRSESDVPLEIINLTEKQRFMDGEKNIAIISEAASSGISLQADRRAINQRRRVHITLELPWSADRAVQQFGRTHRSNQVVAPEYIFMISELAGERRFAATVAKRLESLGALTHGDRRATESRDLSRFNIDNKYGRAALESVMKSILRHEVPIVGPPDNYSGNFFDDARNALIGVGMVSWNETHKMAALEKDYNNMSKFLNRILGIPVELQNMLFKYFQDTLKAIILQAKRNGRWDMGILDLGSGEENVRLIDTQKFISNFSGNNVKTQLNTVCVERGMSWTEAMNKWHDHSGPDDGFYISAQIKNSKKTAHLAVAMGGKKGREKLFSIYRPNTGLQLRAESLEEIRQKYRKVLPDTAQPYWDDQYYASVDTCSHAYWRGNCKRTSIGLSCEVGLRCRTYYVLSGSVLGCWTKVEAVLASLPGGHATRMQIIRLKTNEKTRIVGTLIPEQALKPLKALLSSKTPIEEPPHIQQIMKPSYKSSPSHLSQLRNTPSPSDFTSSPLLKPSMSNSQPAYKGLSAMPGYASSPDLLNHKPQFRTVNSSGATLHRSPSTGDINLMPKFKTIPASSQKTIQPKFRVTPASAKPVVSQSAVRVNTPAATNAASFTVMSNPEDEFQDMPSFL